MLNVLAGAGLSFLKDLLKDNGEQLVKEGIKKVTGIELKDTLPTPEEIQKIKEMELQIKQQVVADRDSARRQSVDIQNSNAPVYVKLNRTLISQFTILLCFALFFLVLTGQMDMNNPNVALIVGGALGYVSQILSFFFGSAEDNNGNK